MGNPAWVKSYTEEQENEVRAFLLAGNTAREIAEATGMKDHTIRHIKEKMLKEGVIEKPPPRAVLTKPGEKPDKALVLIRDVKDRENETIRKLMQTIEDQKIEIDSLKALLKRYMK